MVILGIDPGSCITGFGVIQAESNRLNYVISGHIQVTEEELACRLQQIYSGIREVVLNYQPQEIAVEQVFMHQNPGSALKLGQARGVAIIAASLEGQPVFEYSAKQVKQAVVGYGAAAKTQIQQMICSLLHLSSKPQADAADALAVAVCHANSRKQLLIQKTRSL
jgi:crossover junction endodeoxyribonuclease RuvC